MIQADARESGARFLLLLASLVVVIAGMKAAASLILPFLVAVFLSLISLPLLNGLIAVRVPTPLAVLVTVLVALLVLSGVVVIIGGSLRSFTDQAPEYKERLEAMSAGLVDWLEGRGIDVSEQISGDLINPGRAMDLVTGTLRGVTAVLSNVVLVLLTIVFILSEAAGFPDKLRAALGRKKTPERFANIRREVQRYLGIKTLVSLNTGILVWAALAILGVDFALLWGTLAFFLNFIPTLGSVLAAVPPVLLALVQLGWLHAVGVAILFATINVVLGGLVEPYFMGRRLGLSTLVVFLSLVFWGWVWGPVGMILSVPLTMVLKIMLENTEDFRWIAVLLDAGARPAPDPAPER